ncbi:phospholipid scramblase family protein [Flavobacterium azooxidireducens]|uniref:Phospholipid scramblase family protein n=1 Tax=Flavobacterium azooxidireducens TaxID=1871076 RepID=A0ABY4KAP5_9FLAO|nr:phospholipid scramblase family protein [Flavobacterium azooxidireducens]UPQ77867.1 phospholipid scramblase family protein [Flavobacterium azooxidireducens]
MNSILNRNIYLIKEHIGMFKASNNFDVFNPDNGSLIMTCREPNLGFFTKLFRFTDYKRMTPFNVVISDTQGKKIISVKRGTTILRSDVEIFDESDKLIGVFKQKFFSFGGKFEIHDANDKHLCTLQGKWTGWDFKFIKDNRELAHVSKKWSGIGKEFFTSADNYVLEIYNHVPQDDNLRPLIVASVMCIDMVFKE